MRGAWRIRLMQKLNNERVLGRARHRQHRSEWIQNISAGCGYYNSSYSRFMHGLRLNAVRLNRKILAHLVSHEPASFRAIMSLTHMTASSVYREDFRDAEKPRVEWRPPSAHKLRPDPGRVVPRPVDGHKPL